MYDCKELSGWGDAASKLLGGVLGAPDGGPAPYHAAMGATRRAAEHGRAASDRRLLGHENGGGLHELAEKLFGGRAVAVHLHQLQHGA